jgi:hypothetical protein
MRASNCMHFWACPIVWRETERSCSEIPEVYPKTHGRLEPVFTVGSLVLWIAGTFGNMIAQLLTIRIRPRCK